MTPAAIQVLAAGFASKFDEIGPYVGFASLVAVAAMGVLVLTQGRELQRLREWAGTAPERLEELERQLATGELVGRQQPPLAARPAQPQVARPGQQPQVARPAGAGAPGAVPAAAAAAAGVQAPPPPPGTAAGAPTQVAMGASVTPPAPPAGGAPPRPTPPRPTPPGTNGAGGPGGPRSTPLSQPRPATVVGAASTARERGETPRRSVLGMVAVAGVSLVVLVALLFALGVIGGDGETQVDRTNESDAKAQQEQRQVPAYSASGTKVVVLNGSGAEGLGGGVTERLENARFDTGTAATYTENGSPVPQTTTTVAYTSGNREAALAIAKRLQLRTSTVRAMNATIRSAAEGSPDVVVVLGADFARSPLGTRLRPESDTSVPNGQQLPNSQTNDAGPANGGASSTGGATGTSGTSGTTGGGTGTGTGTGIPGQ
ncbi:LytR C-terminal domain-containing protein [Patulibacter brassicae]|uniref:LytR C-terminal domain-containing protein n=1 Tax=Patulibacter brassicae TaxID=1705717 RepID=A0ABU4VKR1_9ACTN|nr:LytR C-terminal domain-containing protein [Patulibacter brassicae]MDX8152439.1 LytR C-terminal domain-containing protein [Patulibacter brassicae]